jgi:hypothetical protein
MRARAVFTPDAARNGNQVILRACPGSLGSPRFRRRLSRFRRFSNGSLALAFPHLACRDLVSTFLQRSPPSLFTTAACSGLKPAPDRRLRGAHPHLSYSIAPPYVGTFVTHSQKRRWPTSKSAANSPLRTMSVMLGATSKIRYRPYPQARWRHQPRCRGHERCSRSWDVPARADLL